MSEQNVLPPHNENIEDLQDFVFHWVKQFNAFHFHDKWLNIPKRSYTNGLSTEMQIQLAQCVFADLLSRPHLRQAQKVYTSLLSEKFLTNDKADSRYKGFPLYEIKNDTRYFKFNSLKKIIKQEVDAGCAMYAAMEHPIAPVSAASNASDKGVVKRIAVPLADVLVSMSKDPDENIESNETVAHTPQTLSHRIKNKM